MGMLPKLLSKIFSTSGGTSSEGFPDGIRPLFGTNDAEYDIVFVHGVHGHPETTWTAQGLRTTIPKSRVVAYGHRTCLADRGTLGNLNDQATSLLGDLWADRQFNNRIGRRIIFVCHRLGGLLCQRALYNSRNSPDSYLRDIYNSTRGIIFLETTTQAIPGRKEVQCNNSSLAQSANPKELNGIYRDVQAQFRDLIKCHPIHITCFYDSENGCPEMLPKSATCIPANDDLSDQVCGQIQWWIKSGI